MAKNRMVSTSFWSDHYTADLDPIEKLLFLYLLTCERSTLAGVYELPIKLMAVETGIENEMVKKILGRFEEDGKVKYQGGWVAIKNFLKHHEHGSPTVKKGISDAISTAPEWTKEFIFKGIDTLSPSASSLASASIAAAPVEKVYESEEETPSRKKKDTSYLVVFEEFGKKQGWWLHKPQIEAAKRLLEIKGVDNVRAALEFYRDHKGEQYLPEIHTPFDLEAKWSKLFAFKERV